MARTVGGRICVVGGESVQEKHIKPYNKEKLRLLRIWTERVRLGTIKLVDLWTTSQLLDLISTALYLDANLRFPSWETDSNGRSIANICGARQLLFTDSARITDKLERSNELSEGRTLKEGGKVFSEN